MKNLKYVCIITFISVLTGIIFLYCNLYIISAQTPPIPPINKDEITDKPIFPSDSNKIYNTFPKIAKQSSSGFTQQIGGSNEDILFYQYSLNDNTYFGGYSSSDDYDIKNQTDSLLFFKMNNQTGEIDSLYTLPIGNKCEFVKSSVTALGILSAVKSGNSFMLIKCGYDMKLEILDTINGYNNYDFFLRDKNIFSFSSNDSNFSITEFQNKSKNTVVYSKLGEFIKIVNNVNSIDVFYIKENLTYLAEFDGVVLKTNRKIFDFAIGKIEQVKYKSALNYIFSSSNIIITTDSKYSILNKLKLDENFKYIYLDPFILIFQPEKETEKEELSIYHFDLNLLAPSVMIIDNITNIKTAYNETNKTSYILLTVGKNTIIYSYSYLKLSIFKSYENTKAVSIEIVYNKILIGLIQKSTSVLSTYNNSIDILIISEKL